MLSYWKTPPRAAQIDRQHACLGMESQENHLGHRDGPDFDLERNREEPDDGRQWSLLPEEQLAPVTRDNSKNTSKFKPNRD